MLFVREIRPSSCCLGEHRANFVKVVLTLFCLAPLLPCRLSPDSPMVYQAGSQSFLTCQYTSKQQSACMGCTRLGLTH